MIKNSYNKQCYDIETFMRATVIDIPMSSAGEKMIDEEITIEEKKTEN